MLIKEQKLFFKYSLIILSLYLWIALTLWLPLGSQVCCPFKVFLLYLIALWFLFGIQMLWPGHGPLYIDFHISVCYTHIRKPQRQRRVEK